MVAADLKKVYRAETAELAEIRLSEFEEKWDSRYSPIGQAWRRNWEKVTVFFSYPEDIRRAIYTTNAIESLHMSLRKMIKNRGHFPSDEAATRLLFLALKNAQKKWTMPIVHWKKALVQFMILFSERMPDTITD
jgi:putative transposase